MWIALGIIGTLWIVGMCNLPSNSAKSAQSQPPSAASQLTQAPSDHTSAPPAR